MKQALEAFKFSNISVDEYGSTTRVSADVLCLYIALSYKHLHLQYKLYLHFAYLRTGYSVPDNSGLHIFMLLYVLYVYTGSSKRLRIQSWNFADWLHITIYELLTPCSMCNFDVMGNLQLINRNLTPLLICVLEI